MRREFGPKGRRNDPASVVTVGTFDGVHRGHQAVLRYLCQRAAAVGGPATVVSFDPHPRAVLRGGSVPLLTTIDERADLLEAAGVDRFVVLPFSRDLADLEPEDYVRDVLLGQVGMREIVIGHDHRFGRGRRGDEGLLRAMGAEHGFAVDVIPAEVVGVRTVSSTAVRELLLQGNVVTARTLLGRDYALTGLVVRGDQRGRVLGFPTANLRVDSPDKLVPARGVYAVRVALDGQQWPAMMNIGVRPTVDGSGETRLEAHVFDFGGDLYGRTLRVAFVERLRDEQRFEGVEALVRQLHRDAEAARAVLAA